MYEVDKHTSPGSLVKQFGHLVNGEYLFAVNPNQRFCTLLVICQDFLVRHYNLRYWVSFEKGSRAEPTGCPPKQSQNGSTAAKWQSS